MQKGQKPQGVLERHQRSRATAESWLDFPLRLLLALRSQHRILHCQGQDTGRRAPASVEKEQSLGTYAWVPR